MAYLKRNVACMAIEELPIQVSLVTLHYQMRHKSQVQILRCRKIVIEKDMSYTMLQELGLYLSKKLNHDLCNANVSSGTNLRKLGLKIALVGILNLIQINLTHS